MDCSMPGYPVHHQLPEFAQPHVHWVGDAIDSVSCGSCVHFTKGDKFWHKFVPDCLFFLCVCVLVVQSCPTLRGPTYPMDCSPPGSSVYGIVLAKIHEWVAIPFSRGPSQSRDQTQVSWIAGRFFTIWATREAPGNFPLFRKITWGEGRLVSKNQLWRFCSTMNFLKGESFGERVRIVASSSICGLSPDCLVVR